MFFKRPNNLRRQVTSSILLLSFFVDSANVMAQSTNVVEFPIVSTSKNYVNNMAPLKSGRLIKLPVKSIKPSGWLMRYMELQRDGLTGQLGTISAWLDKENNQWLSDSGDHGWEEVPYWLRGYSNLAYILDDQSMINETKSWIEAVLANQKGTGFLGPANKVNDKYELWAQMIMLWCLQDYYEYSGDERVLKAMKNYMHWETNVADDYFLEDYWEKCRGGDNMWSAIWLYNRTGDSRLLTLIEQLHRNTSDWTLTNDLPNWHGVNVAQGFREPATYYLYKGDSTLIKASYNDHNLMRTRFGQVPGGMYGADENVRTGYTDPRQGTETCALVEQMASDEIMMSITGDSFWADNCEDVAFNTLPAAFTEDFGGLRYLTCPNMTVSDAKNHNPSIDNTGPFLAMNPFSSRCCQHNHGMGWPYYVEHMVMATTDNGLATMLYGACETTALVADNQQVKLTEQTHYPFEEDINFKLTTASDVSFPLYIRIPSWAKDASVTVNGEKLDVVPEVGKYVRIERLWHDNDEISVNFPMNITTRVWTANKGSVSINYGPLTLSLDIDENYVQRDSREIAIGDSHWQDGADPTLWPAYEIFSNSAWNYALVLNKKYYPKNITVVHKDWPANDFPFGKSTVPLEFTALGRPVPSWTSDATGLCGLLPLASATKSAEESIKLVPMGAARLRISAFPRSIDVNATDVENIANESLQISVSDGNVLELSGAESGEQITICRVDGVLVKSITTDGNSVRIALPDNIVYLVKYKNNVAKVAL